MERESFRMSPSSAPQNRAPQDQQRKFEPVALPFLPDWPFFSVLIPNYNYGRYLGMALESLLRQTYPHFEAIVSDDGSTDNSREIVQTYAMKDPRVRLLAMENGGFAAAVNRAYAASKGDIVTLLDADDAFRSTKLEKVLAAFKSNPRSGLCVHPFLPISGEGQPLGPPFPQNLDWGWLAPQASRRGGWTILPATSSLSFRSEIAALLFPIPIDVKRLVDYYLSRTAQFLTEVSIAPDWLTQYRIHGANMSGLSPRQSYAGLRGMNALANERFIEDIEEVLPVQKRAVRRFYGDEAAQALRLEDHPLYWDTLLSIRALRGRRAGAIRPYSVHEMISHVTTPQYRRIWRAIALLPDPLARRAYRFWRTPSGVKTLFKKAVPWLAP